MYEFEIAKRAASAGGEIIKRYFNQFNTQTVQSSGENKIENGLYQGIVTQADIESESAIAAVIKTAFPDHAILAEETLTADVDNDHLWIVDPLDGTNNFAHGIPHFAVSIGYYQNGIAKVGVVLDPIHDQWYTAVQGLGAKHNDRLVRVNGHQTLDQTMLAVGFYYDRGQMMRATLSAMEELFHQNIHGFRRMGTAALDLVQVGLGRFGGFFEYSLSPWDFAAAKLFVEEAGGRVTDCAGSPIRLEKTTMLASNGILHERILEIVRKHQPV